MATNPRIFPSGLSGDEATRYFMTRVSGRKKTFLDPLLRPVGDGEHAQEENPGAEVPVDMVTTSVSGLDPHISPASADFQVPRVAKERGLSQNEVRLVVHPHKEGRQIGFLGEPRVNVLELNLELNALHPTK